MFLTPPTSARRLTDPFPALGQKLWRLLCAACRGPAPAEEPSRAALASLVVAVCTAIFAVKGFIAWQDLSGEHAPPRVYDGHVPAWLGRTWLCCAEDFAVGLGLLGLADGLWRCCRSRHVRAALWALAYVAAAAAAAYMVVNAQLFHLLRRFLTWSLFELGGGFQAERSVWASVTVPLKLALVLVPLATLTLHLEGVRRWPRPGRLLARWLCRPLPLLVLVVALAQLAQVARAEVCGRVHADFARNPHLLLAYSCLKGLGLVPGHEKFADLADDADVGDFLPGRPGHGVALDKRPRNIILVVLESTSISYLQNYGCPLPTTPCLDQLEREGKSVRFENCYSTATHTIASALPLFSSTHNEPSLRVSTVVTHPEFPHPAAAAWLHEQGYRTYFLGAGGKSVWAGYRNLGEAFLPHGFDLARCGYKHWTDGWRPWPFLDENYTDKEVFADASKVLREVKGDKFFLMLWNYDTHWTYAEGDGPSEWDEGRFTPGVRLDPWRLLAMRRYLNALWRIDRLVGRLYRELEELGLADDTLIVFTADHGEAFGQHPGIFFHGFSLYDEDVHVPLVFISPRLGRLGPTWPRVGSHVDVWPTITDVCGIPADPRWQGRSLLAGERKVEGRAYFYRGGHLGVRDGKYKYLWDYDNDEEELFDLEADPGERYNVAANHPAYCAELRRRLRYWVGFEVRYTAERLRAARR